MILVDVNVLVAAYRRDHPFHPVTADWLQNQINLPSAYGMPDRVLEGFIRVVTHPGIYVDPDPVDKAIEFTRLLTERTNCVRVNPGARQWDLFVDLVSTIGAVGNSVSDAWLAALAIESGAEWVTWDRGFARFPGLSWSTPGVSD